ncbi:MULTISPECIES: AI-2E family transporter [unclassified Oceanobacter]|jgi:predicted PurR-regulated permease PerM|uniref:AI-2E family transporter n=2 Tax=Gammaproteobacteria TaxID=1236 RepID=UPI0026E1C438|nr:MULTISPECIES: AI-2E family transporter [unclassified Oceanobacter]MDO6680718.1 AI-2E family transporter [Oceanobacter sp. 5_MG-2023]MDP2607883.1 AI-2E family transporter [Oceanobacter sp. 1_MG-2023]MDP2610933.1 AI-2E family transporter [Oceanobacter sp. 2_MG-2023]
MSTNTHVTSNIFVTLAAAIIVIAGVRSAADILVPFLLSVFIAVLSAPMMHWLSRRGVPDVLAVLLMMLGFLVSGTGLTVFLGGTVNAFYKDIPLYETKLQNLMQGIVAWLNNLGIEVPANLLREYVDPSVVMNMVTSVFNGLGGVLTNAFLILFTVVFILLEASGMPEKLKRAFGEQTSAFAHFERFSNLVQRYLAIKTLMSLGTGVCIGVVLWIIGVDYAPVWAVIAFLLNYIPNIGSIIAAVPAVLIALIQLGPGSALATAITYVVANMTFGNVLEPRMMGRTLGLSTLVVFLSLIFWGWILGPVGMLLSIPLTMVVKIALETRQSTRWMATLLDH